MPHWNENFRLNANTEDDVSPLLRSDLEISIGRPRISWAKLLISSWSWWQIHLLSSFWSRVSSETLLACTDDAFFNSSRLCIWLAIHSIVGWSNSSVLGKFTSNVRARELQSSMNPSESRPLLARISFGFTLNPTYSVTTFATSYSTSMRFKDASLWCTCVHGILCDNSSNIERFDARERGLHIIFLSNGEMIQVALEHFVAWEAVKKSSAETPSCGLRTPMPLRRIRERMLPLSDVIPSNSSPHAPHSMLEIGLPAFCIDSASSSITPFAIA